MTDPTGPIDPTDPNDSTGPTRPARPMTDPTDPNGPTRPTDSNGPTVVVAHVPDLMDRSKLAAVAGIDVTFVGDPAALAATADERGATVVVVDLARAGVLAALTAGGLPDRVVGFGSHVDADLLAAAREAGCTEVLPRSRFFGRLRAAVSGEAD